MKKIVFMGTPEFASRILEYLNKHLLEINAGIVGAYCQPDKAAGRGNKIHAPAVKIKAEELGIRVFQPLNFKDEADIRQLAELNPDVLTVVAYGLILPQKVLDIPTYGAFNIHASLLPKWRGAAPVQRGLLAGDSHTGITVMKMEKGLDTGDILLQQAIKTEADDTTESIFSSLATLAGPLMVAALKQIFEQRASCIPQNNDAATYAHKILKEEYIFSWDLTADEIDRKVRALMTPRTEIETKKGSVAVQITKGKPAQLPSQLADKKNAPVGTVLIDDDKTLYVVAADTKEDNKAYCPLIIKPLGKSAMDVAAFINGYLK